MDQLSIFDIIGRPRMTLRVHFRDYFGTERVIKVDVNDEKEITAAVRKCREDNHDLYFIFYEVIK